MYVPTHYDVIPCQLLIYDVFLYQLNLASVMLLTLSFTPVTDHPTVSKYVIVIPLSYIYILQAWSILHIIYILTQTILKCFSTDKTTKLYKQVCKSTQHHLHYNASYIGQPYLFMMIISTHLKHATCSISIKSFHLGFHAEQKNTKEKLLVQKATVKVYGQEDIIALVHCTFKTSSYSFQQFFLF